MCYEYPEFMQYSFLNRRFVPEEGVELWFMALCLCLRRGWNSGYIHGPVFVPEEGVELWLYSWPCVCA